ncbi:MAG TPA: VOC family protein [Blastocatellia bacterium]|nr:VOC family protein [Blastocatellia bacterium]
MIRHERTLLAVVALLLAPAYFAYGSRQPRNEEGHKMFKGLRLAVYHISDVNKAKAWYAEILGFKPYYDTPEYVGFNIGGFELGLLPAEKGMVIGSNEIAYWGVDSADEAYKYLLQHGAKEHGAVQDVGGGIRAGTVLDPFGNVFGVIENPHFKIEEPK